MFITVWFSSDRQVMNQGKRVTQIFHNFRVAGKIVIFGETESTPQARF